MDVLEEDMLAWPELRTPPESKFKYGANGCRHDGRRRAQSGLVDRIDGVFESKKPGLDSMTICQWINYPFMRVVVTVSQDCDTPTKNAISDDR